MDGTKVGHATETANPKEGQTYLVCRPLFSGIFHRRSVTLIRSSVALRTVSHSISYSKYSGALGSCSISITYKKKSVILRNTFLLLIFKEFQYNKM